jgi:hypothetical protein
MCVGGTSWRRRPRSRTVSRPQGTRTRTNVRKKGKSSAHSSIPYANIHLFACVYTGRLEDEIARMKKNQERRLHRKNAKIVKEGGTPMQLNRPVKPDTTVRLLPSPYARRLADHTQSIQRRCGHCGQMGHMSAPLFARFLFFFQSKNSTN